MEVDSKQGNSSSSVSKEGIRENELGEFGGDSGHFRLGEVKRTPRRGIGCTQFTEGVASGGGQ